MRLFPLASPAALIAAVLMTGNEVGTLVAVHPALSRVPVPGGLLGEQAPDAAAREVHRLRCRWDRLHAVRVALDVTGLVLVALAAEREEFPCRAG